MKNIPAIEGGLPVSEDYLIFGSPAIEEDEINDVVDSLRSGWIGTGPKVKRFEDAFREYIGAKYAVALNSCTAALHLSLLAIGAGSGDEVLTTPMTFTATPAAIIHAGARPVFVDIDRRTMTMDPKMVPAAITERTKAILPVHFAGRPCPMEAIMKIARENNLKVVEDAAHAIETISRGRKVGTIGDLSCFSFYVTKNIVTGEGGMVTTNDEALADWIKILALHGMTQDAWHRFSDEGFKHYDVVYPGFKYNMMDIQAAIGYHQLKRVEPYAERREVIWELYNSAFRELPVIIPPGNLMPGDRHAHHLYTLLLNLEDLRISRDRFVAALHRENIGSGIHYRALHLHPFYAEQYHLRPGMFPESEFVSERTVSLPFSAKLTDADVENVIKAVTRILNYYAK